VSIQVRQLVVHYNVQNAAFKLFDGKSDQIRWILGKLFFLSIAGRGGIGNQRLVRPPVLHQGFDPERDVFLPELCGVAV
jgi:hypothetical protein